MFGLFFEQASEEMFCQVGGWFVEGGGLQDVLGTQVPCQQLTYIGSLFFFKRVEISSSPTEQVKRASLKCIDYQLCFFVKQTNMRTKMCGVM